MHDKAVEQVKDIFSDCKCLKHCNLGGVQPDLTCICSPEPVAIIEVETPKSLQRRHTKNQVLLLSRYAEEGNDQFAIAVSDGTNVCGIPLNDEGKKLLRERKINACE